MVLLLMEKHLVVVLDFLVQALREIIFLEQICFLIDYSVMMVKDG